jgi:hypothetical protein
MKRSDTTVSPPPLHTSFSISRACTSAPRTHHITFRFLQYDGSWPDYLELRDRLFAVSGRKGKYPQCFISRGSKGNEKFEFVGMWEDIENLADMDTIPADFLASHPEIKTFSRVFADVQRTASN